MLDTLDERIAATNMVTRIYMGLTADGVITLADTINMSFQYIEFNYPPPVPPVIVATEKPTSHLSVGIGVGVR